MEKSTSTRIFVITLGLIVAYFAVYFGDGMYVLAMADLNVPKAVPTPALIGIGLLAIVLTIVGGFLWFAFMIAVLNEEEVTDSQSAVLTAFMLWGLSCVFGVLAGPFTNYGAYPWSWASKWVVLLLVALVPVAFVLHGVVLDIASNRREHKTTQSGR
jgi:hypothetical protein